MQIFAVILAAIAALAATGQAYLLWQQREDGGAKQTHAERVAICQSALSNLDEARMSVRAAEAVNDPSSVTKPWYNSIYMSRIGYAEVYFNSNELDALGIEEVEQAYRLKSSAIRGDSEEALKAALEAVRAAAAKFDSAKAVCAPIMLGEVK